MKEYPKCPYIAIRSVTVYEGTAVSWTCLRLKRTVCEAHCEQCKRTIMCMANIECR